MDLALTEEEQAFAAEVRAFLAAHLEPPPAFTSTEEEVVWGRTWQATLAAARLVGIMTPKGALRAAIPEITEVVDVTDHAGGANPDY